MGGGLLAGPGAEASASHLLGLPEGWDPGDCAEYAPVLDSLFPGGSLPLAATLSPLEGALGEVGSRVPPLGILSGPWLLDWIEKTGVVASRVASPPPTSGCPDSEVPVLMGSESDLSVDGVRLCGLLVVSGDLRIEGSGMVQGLALVGGDLYLGGSSRFEGLARVRGWVYAEGSAKIRISTCSAIRALSETPSLLKPLLLPGASRIPIF